MNEFIAWMQKPLPIWVFVWFFVLDSIWKLRNDKNIK